MNTNNILLILLFVISLSALGLGIKNTFFPTKETSLKLDSLDVKNLKVKDKIVSSSAQIDSLSSNNLVSTTIDASDANLMTLNSDSLSSGNLVATQSANLPSSVNIGTKTISDDGTEGLKLPNRVKISTKSLADNGSGLFVNGFDLNDTGYMYRYKNVLQRDDDGQYYVNRQDSYISSLRDCPLASTGDREAGGNYVDPNAEGVPGWKKEACGCNRFNGCAPPAEE